MRILAVCLMVSAFSMQALHAQAPSTSIDLPSGVRTVLRAKGDGVQIYDCTVTAGEGKWILKAPEAKLLDASGRAIGRHFAGPTWRLDDGSQVQGELVASKPAPDAGSIAWLLVRAKSGTASGKLADVTLIRRTDTHGGVAPASGCQTSQDSGKTVRIPYTAMYTFYAGSAER